MKILYLELGMGAAGDMLSAALTELLPEPGAFIEKLNAVGVPGVRFVKERSVKCGITGTHMRVLVNDAEERSHDHAHAHDHANACLPSAHGEHHHGSMDEIRHIVYDHLQLSDKIKKEIMDVYALLADAESRVHGVPVTDIHFHEVGTMDALADITAVCMLIDALAPDRIVASPVHVGAGHVRCAHGILPVPAPATAELLRGIPSYGGSVTGELCTPTGAALLKYFVTAFGDMPVMAVERIGYGMGKKDFETANCVRAMLGEQETRTQALIELSFNVDDMTAEEIGFATEKLFECGANEVFTVPVGMKKNRPGTLVCVLCERDRRQKLVEAAFRHTTTLGIRENELNRYRLERRIETVDSAFGPVRRKVSYGCRVEKTKLEYDDLARIARENDLPLREVRRIIERET